MTTKSGAQHLKSEVHLADAEHHDAMAKTKNNQAGHFRAMVKEAGMTADGQSSHGKMAAELDHEASLHEAHAAHHRSAADKCAQAEKAAADQLNKLQPTNVSGIAPERPTIRPVIRTGGAPLQTGKIDPVLAKIAGLSETDMNWDEESLSM